MSQQVHVFRFLGTKIRDDLWEIDPSEHKHILKVLRMTGGEAVECFDGYGSWSKGALDIQGPNKILATSCQSFAASKSQARFILALGALKHGDIDTLLPDLIELGVDELALFVGQGDQKDRINQKQDERWQRIVTASMKQSKRVDRMVIVKFASLQDLVEHYYEISVAPTASKTPVGVVLKPNGHQFSKLHREFAFDQNSRLLAVVGPEKGFTQVEEDLLEGRRFVAVRIGPHILRATTAAVAIAAIAVSSLNP